MPGLTKTTQSMRKEDVSRDWHIVDMKGQILGRGVTEVSQYLIGKHKPTFTPHVDNGDYVVVINAKDVKVSGRKKEDKVYTRYSGYPGGLKELTYKQMMEKDPRKIIENAVSGMIPKNKHRNPRMKRLFVYTDENHPHKDKLSKK